MRKNDNKPLEITELEKLSIISRICTELENNLGSGDRVLAEFMLDLYERSHGSLDEFKQNIVRETGEDENLDEETIGGLPLKLITALFRVMDLLYPKTPKEVDGEHSEVPSVHALDKSDEIPPKFSVKEHEQEISNFRKQAGAIPALSLGNSERIDKPKDYSDRRRGRSRSPQQNRNNHQRQRSPKNDGSGLGRQRERNSPDPEPILYEVYEGRVTSMRNFGAFVQLEGVRGRIEGMVHISMIADRRIQHPNELLERGKRVKVKVMNIVGRKISLSMRDVDQATGRDYASHLQPGMEPPKMNSASSSTDFLPRDNSDNLVGANRKGKRGRRLGSPELWEMKQLIASGVMDKSVLEDLEAQNESYSGEVEEDVEIEVREEDPPFLKGQSSRTLNLDPIKVVKVPDGTLNRAAIAGLQISKERKEMKRQKAEEAAEEISKDVNEAWDDPLAKSSDKHLAGAVKLTQRSAMEETSEFKKVFSRTATYGKRTSLSIQEQRESLPIFQLREPLLQAISENQLMIVVGDTGSGKTTQMTQYLAEEGYTTRGIIGCTQPRRVAAMSVAKRVAEEVGCRVGQEVGYTIRFEDCTSPETQIKYMTDGMLLREALIDPDLSKYSVILLDEAHERTIHTDVLFGLLKETIKKRPDLKLIVTSATLDAEKFSSYFFNCPIFTIPGRTFPVEVLYTKDPESDYLDASLITVMQIHLNEPSGDILVFLTGQEEIDTACETLYQRMKALGNSVPELIILPVYSALPSEMQSRIFEPTPPGSRKVIIATNIAETSLTIDGIFYVVDPGFVKQNCYDPKLGMDQLVVVPISQAQARQRSGRAGRTGPGKCYRLYTEAAYHNEMLPSSLPEIQRTNLANTVLTLKAMGINDLAHFDFMDPPPLQTLMSALENLYSLGALDEEGFLTRVGRRMAEFPLEPQLSKILIVSVDMGCSEEILTIVAMLSVPNIFYRPRDKQELADQRKSRFHQPEGDHMTLLAVYNGWKNSNYASAWCFENFIQERAMKRAQDVRKQLLGIMDRYQHEVLSCGRNYVLICKAITAGFFRNAAKKDPQEGYRTIVESTSVFMHPSSALYYQQPDWLIYHELLLTTKEYMRVVTAIDPKWLVETAPTFYKTLDASILSRRKRAEKIEPLFNKHQEKDEWRLSKIKKNFHAGRSFSSSNQTFSSR